MSLHMIRALQFVLLYQSTFLVHLGNCKPLALNFPPDQELQISSNDTRVAGGTVASKPWEQGSPITVVKSIIGHSIKANPPPVTKCDHEGETQLVACFHFAGG